MAPCTGTPKKRICIHTHLLYVYIFIEQLLCCIVCSTRTAASTKTHLGHTRIYTHTHVQIHIHVHMHANIHTSTHTPYIRAYISKYTQIRPPGRLPARTPARTPTRPRARPPARPRDRPPARPRAPALALTWLVLGRRNRAAPCTNKLDNKRTPNAFSHRLRLNSLCWPRGS